MKIEAKKITVRELARGYKENPQEGGVVGFGGKLDIRPPYQREFIYKDKQRDAVIETVKKDFPLNAMYWAMREDGNFEVIDGQQRTISICQYVIGDYSINGLAFHNLPKDKQEKILNYVLMIYFCSGNDSEKLEWFQTINIAGMKLTDQELRNAVYHGSWVSDAKRYFSKTGCPAYGLAAEYMAGLAIRQEYLETAIDWISGGKIEDYMSKHQHDKSAEELWQYFQEVIMWVQKTFLNYRKEMKGASFGIFYNEFKNKEFDSRKLEREIIKLMEDEEVGNQRGIYDYVLTRNERSLNLRTFDDKIKRRIYEKQRGICPHCKGENKKKKWKLEEMEGDHKKLWSEGGKTIPENCQMLCKDCHREKSGK